MWAFDSSVWRKIRTRVVPNLRYLPRSQLRYCRACQRATIFVCIGATDEFRLCLRCRANVRYELLAIYLRQIDLSSREVLELDFSSPLRPLLEMARSYTRSFYRPDVEPGTVRADGVVCQDITRLTYPDESLDLIVSSDVLEHVLDVRAAFVESARVLRPGGAHVFTVPMRSVTAQRATMEGGAICHLVPPEYHLDPLDPRGVLAFWDFGEDLPEYFAGTGLKILPVVGPEGPDSRLVWAAYKSAG